MSDPTPYDDIIDSRDLQKLLEDLELIAGDAVHNDETDTWHDPDGEDVTEEAEDLEALREFIDEIRQYSSEFNYGLTLISDVYFTQYAEELAADIGAISPDHQWPLNCIDWEQAARELQQDYTTATWHGQDFWFRIS